MTHVGIVKSFSPQNQYGFIGAPHLAGDVYAHGLSVFGGHRLRPGQTVTFEVVETPRGLRAQRVRIIKRAVQP